MRIEKYQMTLSLQYIQYSRVQYSTVQYRGKQTTLRLEKYQNKLILKKWLDIEAVSGVRRTVAAILGDGWFACWRE